MSGYPPTASNANGRGSGSSGAGRPPADISVVVDDREVSAPVTEKIWDLVCGEARAVSIWALLSPLIRLKFAPLISQAASISSSCSDGETCAASSSLSVLAEWILCLFPRSVAKDLAPGFMFASVWLLFAVRDTFAVVPNVPIRICEAAMGRMTLRDLLIVLPIHFVCVLSTFMMLKLLLPTRMASVALSPIDYSDDNAWLVDFIREVAVNCAFTVTFLVLPELFALNKLPRFLTALVMYPLYSVAVDANGKGSTFGPNVLFALAAVAMRNDPSDEVVALGHHQTPTRFLGVILGGVSGGIIMRRYFPDDPRT